MSTQAGRLRAWLAGMLGLAFASASVATMAQVTTGAERRVAAQQQFMDQYEDWLRRLESARQARDCEALRELAASPPEDPEVFMEIRDDLPPEWVPSVSDRYSAIMARGCIAAEPAPPDDATMADLPMETLPGMGGVPPPLPSRTPEWTGVATELAETYQRILTSAATERAQGQCARTEKIVADAEFALQYHIRRYRPPANIRAEIDAVAAFYEPLVRQEATQPCGQDEGDPQYRSPIPYEAVNVVERPDEVTALLVRNHIKQLDELIEEARQARRAGDCAGRSTALESARTSLLQLELSTIRHAGDTPDDEHRRAIGRWEVGDARMRLEDELGRACQSTVAEAAMPPAAQPPGLAQGTQRCPGLFGTWNIEGGYGIPIVFFDRVGDGGEVRGISSQQFPHGFVGRLSGRRYSGRWLPDTTWEGTVEIELSEDARGFTGTLTRGDDGSSRSIHGTCRPYDASYIDDAKRRWAEEQGFRPNLASADAGPRTDVGPLAGWPSSSALPPPPVVATRAPEPATGERCPRFEGIWLPDTGFYGRLIFFKQSYVGPRMEVRFEGDGLIRGLDGAPQQPARFIGTLSGRQYTGRFIVSGRPEGSFDFELSEDARQFAGTITRSDGSVTSLRARCQPFENPPINDAIDLWRTEALRTGIGRP